MQTHNRLSVVVVYAALLCLALGFWNPWIWMGVVMAGLVLLALNQQLYAFMAHKRGWKFGAASVIPHWLYYGYNGVSFGIGSLLHMIERDPRPGRPATSGRDKRMFALIMAAVLGIAVVLRFYALNAVTLSLAEQQQALAAHSSMGTIARYLLEPVAMPLGLWVTHLALRFGDQNFWLRVAPAFASVLMVALIYRFVGRILGRTGGVVAALVVAAGAFDMYVGRQASGQALFGLLSLLSFHSLFRTLKNNRYDAWIGYAVNTSVCLFTHTFAIFVFCSQIVIAALYLWVLPVMENKKARLASFTVAAGAAVLPWALVLMVVYAVGGRLDSQLINNAVVADMGLASIGGLGWLMLWALLAGCGAIITLGRDRQFGWMMLLWAGLPALFILAAAAILKWPWQLSDMVPVYLAGVVFVSVTILTAGTALTRSMPRWGWALWLIIVAPLLFNGVIVHW